MHHLQVLQFIVSNARLAVNNARPAMGYTVNLQHSPRVPTPMDDFSASVSGGIDTLRISLYSLVNFRNSL